MEIARAHQSMMESRMMLCKIISTIQTTLFPAFTIRNILAELSHPQPSTPIVTNNSTASGIANDTIRQRHSKAMDMRFYWVRDQV